jgi:hypothetical protein
VATNRVIRFCIEILITNLFVPAIATSCSVGDSPIEGTA